MTSARRVNSTEINRRWGELLNAVLGGETIEVVRYDRVVARIVPVEKKPQTVAPIPDPPRMVDAVSPQAHPPGAVGKITTSAERQRLVDEILNKSKKGGRDG